VSFGTQERAGPAALLGAREARCAHSGTQAFDLDTAVAINASCSPGYR